MIKVDIVNEVSKVADITKVKAEVAVDAVFDAMRLSMQRGERIELRGFGVFQVKPRKKGIGRNPRTGREVRIPPGKTIRFADSHSHSSASGVLDDARSSSSDRSFRQCAALVISVTESRYESAVSGMTRISCTVSSRATGHG